MYGDVVRWESSVNIVPYCFDQTLNQVSILHYLGLIIYIFFKYILNISIIISKYNGIKKLIEGFCQRIRIHHLLIKSFFIIIQPIILNLKINLIIIFYFYNIIACCMSDFYEKKLVFCVFFYNFFLLCVLKFI